MFFMTEMNNLNVNFHDNPTRRIVFLIMKSLQVGGRKKSHFLLSKE